MANLEESANVVETSINKLLGLSNLLDLAADRIDDRKEQAFNFCSVIGIGAIIGGIATDLANLDMDELVQKQTTDH